MGVWIGVKFSSAEKYPPMKMTACQVETVKPKEKLCKLADVGGLYLLVNPNGKRYRCLEYRLLAKEKLLAIGVYPEIPAYKAVSFGVNV